MGSLGFYAKRPTELLLSGTYDLNRLVIEPGCGLSAKRWPAAARITEDRIMLELDAQSLSLTSRARLLLKYAMFPGTNWISREKSKVVRMFLRGAAGTPIRTLDCGCGNAYFSYQAVRLGSRCTGITIHEWEKHRCEEMRAFLGITADQLEFRLSDLESIAAEHDQHSQFDQVLLFDVIEHILDAPQALRQIHALTAEDGLLYITTPNRDWQGNADRIRVTRFEDGWHVRNGYTFEQLERLLDESGFEPVDRARFGSVGSTLVTKIQHRLFRSWIDPLTVLLFPLLKLTASLLAPFPDPHTIFVLARKKRSAGIRARANGSEPYRYKMTNGDGIGTREMSESPASLSRREAESARSWVRS
jgi:SAM-dependent methyltransferase